MEEILEALAVLRVAPTTEETALHAQVAKALTAAGLPFTHEHTLGPRCRIDFLSGGVGIEIKKGKPVRAKLLAQLERYAGSAEIRGLIAVTERSVTLPRTVGGKPLRTLCLDRLWGIAL